MPSHLQNVCWVPGNFPPSGSCWKLCGGAVSTRTVPAASTSCLPSAGQSLHPTDCHSAEQRGALSSWSIRVCSPCHHAQLQEAASPGCSATSLGCLATPVVSSGPQQARPGPKVTQEQFRICTVQACSFDKKRSFCQVPHSSEELKKRCEVLLNASRLKKNPISCCAR